MSANPVNAWDMLVQAITETTHGTTPAPASTAAYAALCVESINCSLGPAETGVIRAKQDRNDGRGPNSGFVEGRVMPIGWTFDTTIKSRAAIDTASHLLAFFKAAGMLHTINGSTNVTITLPKQPIEGGTFAGMTLRRFLGSGLAGSEAETLRGCVVKALAISGGAGELLAKFSGVGMGKTTAAGFAGVQGKLDSITVADNSTTTITISADESYRFGPGYYLWESEIILVTACTPGGTSATITRGALASVAAAHTSQPIVPYRPTPTWVGSPIAEPTSTVTIDGVACRARSWSLELTTGMDLLEPETGSRYSQGAKSVRTDAKLSVQLVLSGAQVSLLGKATAKKSVAVAIVQGTGTGGVFTLNVPAAEIVAPNVPDTAGDIAVVDVSIRLYEATPDTLLNIVLT